MNFILGGGGGGGGGGGMAEQGGGGGRGGSSFTLWQLGNSGNPGAKAKGFSWNYHQTLVLNRKSQHSLGGPNP